MACKLRVIIVTPTYLPDITGNAVTARRIYKGLKERGVEVEVVRSSECGMRDIESKMQSAFTLIHALHARKSGGPAMELSCRYGVPFVVTITGTDLNIDLMQHGSGEAAAALDKARAVIVYSGLARDSLLSTLPSISGKVVIIRPSVDIKERRETDNELPAGFNFLLPSGIRRVKDPVFAIRPLELLRREFPSINLSIMGPVLDGAEWDALSLVRSGKGWISHKEVSHEEMPGLFNKADVVLNTSMSEGLSNSVMEAMSLGKAVLASDCEGNRAVISDGEDGLLYRQADEDDFMRKARMLILDLSLRERIGGAAMKKIAGDYSLNAEINGHLKLYEEVLKMN